MSDNFLRSMLGDSLYEAQKEVFDAIVKGGKKELEKRSDDVYILQKDIVKNIQSVAIAAAKKEAEKLFSEKFDSLCDLISKKIPFVGKILVAILRKYKSEIMEAII